MIGTESLLKSVMKDCSEGSNCFNPNGCDKVRHLHLPEDNPRLIAMGFTTKCVANTKCFHDYCGKFKWINDRAELYANICGVTKEDIIKKWEEGRNYWYMNYYQDSKQPLLGDVKVFETATDLMLSVGKKGFRCPKCSGESSDPYECSCDECDWKSFGLFGTLGKGVDVFVKESLQLDHFFTPIAWESVTP